MESLASIRLAMDVSDLDRGVSSVERATKSMQNMGNASDKLNSKSDTLAPRINKNSIAFKEQRKELEQLIDKISPVNKRLEEMASMQERLNKFRDKGILDVERHQLFTNVLDNERNAMQHMLDAQTKSTDKATMSVKQYNQAMRMLPMQFTDIAVSIAGGMPIWMVLMQQGGQIKDMFGGIGNSLKAIASLIKPTMLIFGGIATALGLMAVGYYKGNKEASEFNKQLLLSGNRGKQTKEQLIDMSKALSGIKSSQGSAAAAIAEVVGTGAFFSSEVRQVSESALLMSESFGVAISDTVANFKRLKQDPLKAIRDLDQSMNFLSASQLKAIMKLDQSNDKIGAAKLAMSTYADAVKSKSNEMTESLGYLERAWDWMGNTAAKAWDKVLDVGRDDTLAERIEKTRTLIAQMEGGDSRYDNASVKSALKYQNEQLAVMEKQYAAQVKNQKLEEQRSKRNDDQKKELDEINKRYKFANDYMTRANEKQDALVMSQGLGNLAAERAVELARLRTEWIKRGGDIDSKQFQDMVDGLTLIQGKQDEMSGDWEKGFQSGFANFYDTATNVYTGVSEVASQAFSMMGDTIWTTLKTGESNFKDFFVSVMDMIGKLITQFLLAKAVQAGMGALGISSPFTGTPAPASGGISSRMSVFDTSNTDTLRAVTPMDNYNLPSGISMAQESRRSDTNVNLGGISLQWNGDKADNQEANRMAAMVSASFDKMLNNQLRDPSSALYKLHRVR